MKAKTIKVVATAAVLVAALSGLMYTTLSEDGGLQACRRGDDDPAAWHGKRMSLHGFVAGKSIFAKPDTRLAPIRDSEQRQGHPRALYRRDPDTFKDGSEVVLKGKLGPHGFDVSPNGVMAKCRRSTKPRVLNARRLTPNEPLRRDRRVRD